MEVMEDIVKNKTMIITLLDDQEKFNIYLGLLYSYFTYKISKEEMAHEAAKLLTIENINLHNQFIISIIKKIDSGPHFSNIKHSSELCQSLFRKAKVKEDSGKKKSNPRKMRSSYRQIRVRSAIMITCVPRAIPRLASTFSCCSLLGAFPDARSIYGSIFVYAFAHDIDIVPELCAIYVALAVKELMKNILTSVFSKRRTFRLHNYFPHDVKHTDTFSQKSSVSLSDNNIATSLTEHSNLVPKMRPTVEWGECKAARAFTFNNSPSALKPVSLREVYDVLIAKSEILPVTSIHARILEYCVVKLQASNYV